MSDRSNGSAGVGLDLLDQRDVVIVERHVGQAAPPLPLQLSPGAQVDDGEQSQLFGQQPGVVGRDRAQRVTAEQAAPPDPPAVDGVVAAEVTEVDGPAQADPALRSRPQGGGGVHPSEDRPVPSTRPETQDRLRQAVHLGCSALGPALRSIRRKGRIVGRPAQGPRHR